MKKIISVFTIITMIFCLVSCSISADVPTDGLWYCKELGITIDFTKVNDGNKNNSWKFAVDGTIEYMWCHRDHGNGMFFSQYDEDCNQTYFIGSNYNYTGDELIIRVHHATTPFGSVVEVDNENIYLNQ